eukprot:TRINITY_DN243660_c0_g1_i1.p1 TRINITY_DN243660_c0_g1~~TRINITY_DN243660_c0_g1_i1.p1  ORF type:complete len:527 (+),score=69.97 TRINITY_DN243660_c0_g1_i1:102-1682(+)
MTLQKQDWVSLLILVVLYTLQGIPMGLAQSVPLLLADKNIPISQQSIFSLTSWPFALKLLWAPIIDGSNIESRFIKGRRRSFLIPIMFLMGILMLGMGCVIDGWISSGSVITLALSFGLLYTLTATQDIVVDGWALTMLPVEHVSLASTANVIGQTVGFMVAYTVFLGLNSVEFCNQYLRSVPATEGLLNLGSFTFFWGVVFCIVTAMIWMFTSEKKEDDVPTIWGTYKQCLKILKLKTVGKLILVLLTIRFAFGAIDAITPLKLLDFGVPKENLAFLMLALSPLQIVVPIILKAITPSNKVATMKTFKLGIWFRILAGVFIVVFCVVAKNYEVNYTFYAWLVVLFMLHTVSMNMMFVTQMSFFAEVADPLIGGTYMTLLNTVANMGNHWPRTVALAICDYCAPAYWFGKLSTDNTLYAKLALYSETPVKGFIEANIDQLAPPVINEFFQAQLTSAFIMWEELSQSISKITIEALLTIYNDGFVALVVFSTIIGITWTLILSPILKNLQNSKMEEWRVAKAVAKMY